MGTVVCFCCIDRPGIPSHMYEVIFFVKQPCVTTQLRGTCSEEGGGGGGGGGCPAQICSNNTAISADDVLREGIRATHTNK